MDYYTYSLLDKKKSSLASQSKMPKLYPHWMKVRMWPPHLNYSGVCTCIAMWGHQHPKEFTKILRTSYNLPGQWLWILAYSLLGPPESSLSPSPGSCLPTQLLPIHLQSECLLGFCSRFMPQWPFPYNFMTTKKHSSLQEFPLSPEPQIWLF